jgi:hypothetical protein
MSTSTMAPVSLTWSVWAKAGESLPAPILDDAPSVKGRSGIGQHQTEHHCRQTELLEPENSCEQPYRGAATPSMMVPRGVGLIASEQPRRDVRHADADEVGEVGGGDHPHRVAHDEKDDCRAGGKRRGRPRAIRRFYAQGQEAGQEPVIGEL